MNMPRPPEKRQDALLQELKQRGHLWMPDWRPLPAAPDVIDVIFQVAARLGVEVAHRFDALPEKAARDFLYWLGHVGRSGTAARLPLVFRLAPGAETVLTSPPIQVQAITPDGATLFEVGTPLVIQRASLVKAVGANMQTDSFSEAPLGTVLISGPPGGIDR